VSTSVGGGVPPFQNTPFVDDWVYAWSVENFLKTGRIEVLDLSTHLNVAQIVWAALVAFPFGFSFTALRVSTVLIALVGLGALYLLLRELDVPRATALVGTASLAVYPVYAVLAFSFMTDVPFVSLTILASLAMVRAIRHQSAGWLVWAAVFAALSIAVRLPGVATPIAMFLTLLVGPGGWGRRRGRWAIVSVIPLLSAVALAYWAQSHVQQVADLRWMINSPEDRIAMLKEYSLRFLPGMLGGTLALLCGTVGLALLPVSAACFRRRLIKPTVGIFAALMLSLAFVRVLLGVDFSLPLVTGNTWALDELGGMRVLVPDFAGPHVPRGIGWAALGGATFLLAVAMAAYGWSEATPAGRPKGGLRRDPVLIFLVLMVAVHALIVALLWLIADRYALVFTPLVLAIVLSARPALSMRTATAAIALYAVVTVIGLRDLGTYDLALWRGVEAMRKMGIPEQEVNAGYVVNGWLLYADADRAPRDVNGNVDVPWVNGGYDPPYRVANAPAEGWEVLAAVPYDRWLGPDSAIYLIKRR
jgi:dolichyl-phosphate-mannose-protein mannosyltransferase